MIVLDTNVVSEIIKDSPNQNVVNWFSKQPLNSLYLTSIVVAELFYGMQVLPEGKRKRALQAKLMKFVEMFEGRIFNFDLDTAFNYADIMASARSRGLAIQKTDGYIVSIAKTHGIQVATRDVSPFRSAGITVINPWDDMD